MTKTGMIIISHVYEIATSFATTRELVNNHSSDHLLAFYDLGSTKMNLEMVKELSNKSITIYDVPIVEGSYTAAALL
jgi:dihydroxyacetone kinase DhaKLM complex PTS-EIIA-like component DhaM